MVRTALVIVAITLITTACSSRKSDSDDTASSPGEATPTVQAPKPEDTVKALFDAAAHDDAAALGALCDPRRENDEDTNKLCTMKSGTKEWDDFKALFSVGKITGATKVDGDIATVPFQFGPERGYKENMQLIRRNDRWYLYKL